MGKDVYGLIAEIDANEKARRRHQWRSIGLFLGGLAAFNVVLVLGVLFIDRLI
jgi:hypothetical protein